MDTINHYTNGVESFIKEGQKNGLMNKEVDPNALALTAIGMIQMSTMKWSLNDFSFSLVKEGMRLWDNFEKCVAAKKVGTKPAN